MVEENLENNDREKFIRQTRNRCQDPHAILVNCKRSQTSRAHRNPIKEQKDDC